MFKSVSHDYAKVRGIFIAFISFCFLPQTFAETVHVDRNGSDFGQFGRAAQVAGQDTNIRSTSQNGTYTPSDPGTRVEYHDNTQTIRESTGTDDNFDFSGWDDDNGGDNDDHNDFGGNYRGLTAGGFLEQPWQSPESLSFGDSVPAEPTIPEYQSPEVHLSFGGDIPTLEEPPTQEMREEESRTLAEELGAIAANTVTTLSSTARATAQVIENLTEAYAPVVEQVRTAVKEVSQPHIDAWKSGAAEVEKNKSATEMQRQVDFFRGVHNSYESQNLPPEQHLLPTGPMDLAARQAGNYIAELDQKRGAGAQFGMDKIDEAVRNGKATVYAPGQMTVEKIKSYYPDYVSTPLKEFANQTKWSVVWDDVAAMNNYINDPNQVYAGFAQDFNLGQGPLLAPGGMAHSTTPASLDVYGVPEYGLKSFDEELNHSAQWAYSNLSSEIVDAAATGLITVTDQQLELALTGATRFSDLITIDNYDYLDPEVNTRLDKLGVSHYHKTFAEVHAKALTNTREAYAEEIHASHPNLTSEEALEIVDLLTEAVDLEVQQMEGFISVFSPSQLQSIQDTIAENKRGGQ